MAKKLTVKESKLVKGIAQGKTKTQAAVDAGYGTTVNSAKAIASKTLTKVNVQEALQAELSRQGISIEQIVAPVTSALHSDNLDMQLKGHDRAIKIIGGNQSGEGRVNVHFHAHQAEQKAKYDL